MNGETARGRRSVKKATTATTITRTKWLLVIFVVLVAFVLERVPSALSPQQPQQPPPTQAQQRPVFRGGTHFVRVDAYPMENGQVIAGLKPEDFEILEDGKPQAIESFDYIKFEGFTPEAELRDPISQRDGFDKAGDPRYRVFVVFVDLVLSRSPGAVVDIDDVPRLQQPLVNFFERVVGPRDLYGFLTTRNTAKDLVLAQKTAVTVSQIKDMWRANFIDRDDADEALWTCDASPDDLETLKLRHRADANYNTLQGLVLQLGSLRQERKNLVLATNLLPRWRQDRTLFERLAVARRGEVPRTGIERGRITNDKRNVLTNDPNANANACLGEQQRLALLDFEPRYHELLSAAVRENVSVYVITPGGLQAPPGMAAQRAMHAAYDDLKSLADATDGAAIIDTNDLDAGFKRIADDLSAYYLLGYYTTNTKFDGGIRKISVRLKGRPVRARREYRAPTEAEIAAMATSSARTAASTPAAEGPPSVVGEATAFRVSPRQPPEQLRLPELTRVDRIRVTWPVLASLERREARLLDSTGKPLPFDLPVSEDAEKKTLAVELALAPFGRGTYSIELTAASGRRTERRRLTFMVK
jgi:VWFA-related protein